MSSSFEYDDQAGWSEQIDFLPIQRRKAVQEKYLFGGLLSMVSLTLIVFLLVLLKKAGLAISGKDFYIGISISVPMSFVYVGLIIPCVYKFGVESSRILLYVIVLFPTLLLGISQMFHMNTNQLSLSKTQMGVALVVGAILWIGVSYNFSVYIYKRKEF